MLKVDINLLFTVINLFILFFVIWKFLFKPVKKIIAERQKEVEAGYAEADKAKADAEETRIKLEEQLKTAESEKAEILKESRVKAGEEYDRIIAQANSEASGILEDAKKNAAEESERLKKKANEELSDLVSKAAAKIALTKEDPDTDRKLFDEFITKTGE
ncbi:MAG: ATP synthase F0 subunit B [Lachnospiraceae bacterium]|nr:ATP synthase F0 subunit B [Lachnospiraceae bacterium]